MDALSSMATVAGYKAVILAADHLPRLFPMLMTACWNQVARGQPWSLAGVADLAAIAAAGSAQSSRPMMFARRRRAGPIPGRSSSTSTSAVSPPKTKAATPKSTARRPSNAAATSSPQLPALPTSSSLPRRFRAVEPHCCSAATQSKRFLPSTIRLPAAAGRWGTPRFDPQPHLQRSHPRPAKPAGHGPRPPPANSIRATSLTFSPSSSRTAPSILDFEDEIISAPA